MVLEVLNLSNIKIPSVNQKYNVGKNGRLFLNPAYKEFKKMVELCCIKKKLSPPYGVLIKISTSLDIDNFLKPLLDGLKKVITDDRDILELYVVKKKIKRTEKSCLKVIIKELEEG